MSSRDLSIALNAGILFTTQPSTRYTCLLWLRLRRSRRSSNVGRFIAIYISLNSFSYTVIVAKRPREPFQPWVPNAKEAAAIADAVVVPCHSELTESRLNPVVDHIQLPGRRGLLNLGQTCFLNVVLQCFLHNPLLRNYFLSDKHNHKLCKLNNCTCCEMDKLFAEACRIPAIVIEMSNSILNTSIPSSIPAIPLPTDPSTSSQRPGGPHRNYLATHNTTPTNSSLPRSTTSTQPRAALPTSLVIASSIRLSQGSCRATSGATGVEM